MKRVYPFIVASCLAAFAASAYASSGQGAGIPPNILKAAMGISVGAPAAPLIERLGLECQDEQWCGSEAHFLTWAGLVTGVGLSKSDGKVTAFDVQYAIGSGNDERPLLKALEHAFDKPTVIPCKVFTMRQRGYFWFRGPVEYSLTVSTGMNINGDPINSFSFVAELGKPGDGGTCTP
ncbi:MAG: hypothetical protein ACRER1_07295 [Gammaproteobacteria bacterium]